MTSYAQGQTAVLSVNFYQYSGGPAEDVTGLTITIVPMAGGSPTLGPTTTGVVHVATGLYSYSYAVPVDLAIGDYAVVWDGFDPGSNPIEATETITIVAAVGAVLGWQPDYITSAELKSYVRIPDTIDDAQIAEVISASSRAVDTATHRQFGRVASTEARVYTSEFRRHRAYRNYAEIDDLQDTTGLLVVDPDGNTVDSSVYKLHPINAPQRGRPYERIQLPTMGDYTITALWGWSAVPNTIKAATKLQGSRFLARRDSPFGVAGSPSDGSEIRLLAKLDSDAVVMVRYYVRDWAFA